MNPSGRCIRSLEGRLRISEILTREKQSVKVEFMLLCFGYKLNKLHKSIQAQSLGVTLYKIQSHRFVS